MSDAGRRAQRLPSPRASLAERPRQRAASAGRSQISLPDRDTRSGRKSSSLVAKASGSPAGNVPLRRPWLSAVSWTRILILEYRFISATARVSVSAAATVT